MWSFGHEHPQKLFSVLKARYLENIKNIQELGNADIARHAKGLATEAKVNVTHKLYLDILYVYVIFIVHYSNIELLNGSESLELSRSRRR